MTNNDILRRIRYALDIKDTDMVKIFKLSNLDVSRDDLDAYLKKEEDDGYKVLPRPMLEAFLDGFITFKRGVK